MAEVANKLVFADPGNQEARDLAADAYEQLGYLSESGTWRNAYLYAAYELRHGTARVDRGPTINPETIKAVPTERLFDLLGVQLNGPKADGKHIVIHWDISDARQSYVLVLEDSALTYTASKEAAGADASLTLTRDTLNAIVLRRVTISEGIQSGHIKIVGNREKVAELFLLFDTFNPNFEIVEPKRIAK